MTRSLRSLTPGERHRIEFWFREAAWLEQRASSGVEDILREICGDRNVVEDDGFDTVLNALYAIGFTRYNINAQVWLADQADSRDKARRALQGRLADAQTQVRMTGSKVAMNTAQRIQEAIDEHDSWPTWHAAKEAESLSNARRFVGTLVGKDLSAASVDELVTVLSATGEIPTSAIDVRVAFEHASSALLNYTDADSWDDASELGRQCVLASQRGDDYLATEAQVPEEREIVWTGVLLGGSVNQNGKRRRTRGAG